MSFSRILCAFAAVFVSATVFAAGRELPPELEKYVAVRYDSSNPAPRFLLFESYVQTVHHKSQLGEFDMVDYVVDTLGFEHSPEGEARAAEISGIFLDAFGYISADNLDEKYRILCSVDPYERTGREIVRSLNTMDAVGKLLAKKHFRISTSLLSTSERKRLMRYLDDLGDSFFYLSFDHRFLLEPGAVSPQEQLKTVCDRLATASTYVG